MSMLEGRRWRLSDSRPIESGVWMTLYMCDGEIFFVHGFAWGRFHKELRLMCEANLKGMYIRLVINLKINGNDSFWSGLISVLIL